MGDQSCVMRLWASWVHWIRIGPSGGLGGRGCFGGGGGPVGCWGLLFGGKNMLEFFRERTCLIILEKEHAGLSGDRTGWIFWRKNLPDYLEKEPAGLFEERTHQIIWRKNLPYFF